jgi:hypothetical protein
VAETSPDPKIVVDSKDPKKKRQRYLDLAANENATSHGLADAARALRPSIATMQLEGQSPQAVETVLRRIDELEEKSAEHARKGAEYLALSR